MTSAVHISLIVSDLARSTEFYRRFFGDPKKLRTDYAKFVSDDPEIHLALQPGRLTGPGPLSHLGIRVDSMESVQAWKDALAGRGLPAEQEERGTCCYAFQDKFWVTDPDGNRWEVYTVLEDVDVNVEPVSVSSAACCQPAAGASAPCCAP